MWGLTMIHDAGVTPMIEMKSSCNRGQGSPSDKAITKTVRLSDGHWKLERLDAIQKQLLTGLAAMGELYKLQDVWTTYSRLLRQVRPDGPDAITAAEVLAELKPCAPIGNRDDVREFGNALRLLRELRAEIRGPQQNGPPSAEAGLEREPLTTSC
jgi:hypothetical protein